MSRATPKLRDFAERLIDYETNADESRAANLNIPAAFVVCDKLRPHLATLMGNGGFRALLWRALVLANAEVRWLTSVHVKADGTFEGLEEIATQVDPEQLADGGVVLLAQLLGLLVAFIGEKLTVRLVREVWPDAPLNDVVFFGEGKMKKQYDQTANL